MSKSTDLGDLGANVTAPIFRAYSRSSAAAGADRRRLISSRPPSQSFLTPSLLGVALPLGAGREFHDGVATIEAYFTHSPRQKQRREPQRKQRRKL